VYRQELRLGQYHFPLVRTTTLGQSVYPDIALYISNYYINILHARLRQKCSSLTLDLFRCNLIASYNYDCGNYTESVDHLFLACDIYTEHRIQLFRGMRNLGFEIEIEIYYLEMLLLKTTKTLNCSCSSKIHY
jgi:hypothetical protein